MYTQYLVNNLKIFELTDQNIVQKSITSFSVKPAEFGVFFSQNGIMSVFFFFNQSSKYSFSACRVVKNLYFDTEDYQHRHPIWSHILQISTSFAVFVVERLLQNMALLMLKHAMIMLIY